MRRALGLILAAAALTALPTAASGAQFGFKDLGSSYTDAEGNTLSTLQAGSHPYAQRTTINPNTEEVPDIGKVPAGQPKELRITLPEGFVGSPDATPLCSSADFSRTVTHFLNKDGKDVNLSSNVALPGCADGSAIGLVFVRGSVGTGDIELATPIYNVAPPPGVLARFGFKVPITGPVVVDVTLSETAPYRVIATSDNITQMQRFFGADVTLWSDPGAASHDEERGVCGAEFELEEKRTDLGDFLGISCPVSIPALPFLTLPRSCQGPLATLFESDSWSGDHIAEAVLTNGPAGEALGMSGCERLGLEPGITSLPTSRSASSPSGLDFGLDLHDEGLTNLEGIANSDVKKVIVTLPKGVTANPSLAEGLEICSQADFARERSDSPFGAGCPTASKIGTVEVETPLLKGVLLRGSVFVAEPYKNPFGTLLALYMSIKEPQRGINVSLAGKVEPDPKSGQLITTFDNNPQTPFSHFRFHFREGGRSPLITPPLCGTYTTEATLTPWANPATTISTAASFTVDHGVGGGPCPPGGTPPFEPGFAAGALNNAAGHYSPFYLRLARRDGDQDLTKFSATLPLGMVAKLAGVDRCPNAQIAIAKAKTGKAELASPSCPANSEIGDIQAGAGVGSQLTYVPGKIYLAGPYNGAPLSVVGIVAAVAGPFDVGTVISRQALVIDPRSAEVRVDGDRSDPIPHILAGIPLAVRDIRAYVDRDRFAINPTSCAPTKVSADIWGGGADVFSVADDSPVARSARFQAADCASLGFKPRLDLTLKGGTSRGAHPKLHGVFRPRPEDANLKDLVLRLPHSAFLDQAHIRTICTRVQFAANSCPKGAIYGHVRALTPLLSEPLEGSAYLRSSNHNLPDLVFDLHSSLGVDFEALARIDSKQGGIRATFIGLPDAPISKVVVDMQGGKKGLIINSTDLCAREHRANAQLSAHNGRKLTLNPPMRASCDKAKHGRG